ncbi:MAG TPA: ATP-binding protein, partial [bacterium]|nr:ATP-binding protein [bacterium]
GFLLPGGKPCPPEQLALTRALHEAQAIVGQQLSIQRPWGEVALLVSAAPLFDAERQVNGAVAVLRDITELKKLDQMKTDFISTVSHELRTPLAAILGYVQLILEGDTGEINDTQRQFLDIVSKNTERLTTLINGLLDLEKIDSGRMQLASARVNLSRLLAEVESTFRATAQQKGLELKSDVEEHLEVQGDADRLVQVFSNLLSNAVKYTPRGSIHLRAAQQDGQVLVSVQDSGIGMTAEGLSKLFTKFYRADDPYTRAAGGTGLGLAISKGIVQQHGGRIDVQSTPGKGSEFRVLLPSAKEMPQAAPAAPELHSAP